MQQKNTAKAVIFDPQFERVLLLVKVKINGGRQYTLPGGVVDPGETMLDALARECEEEVAVRPVAEGLLYICEFIKPKNRNDSASHRVEFGFRCRVPSGYVPTMGKAPDKHQVGVEWVSLTNLPDLAVIPHGIVPVLMRRGQPMVPYLGIIPYQKDEDLDKVRGGWQATAAVNVAGSASGRTSA